MKGKQVLDYLTGYLVHGGGHTLIWVLWGALEVPTVPQPAPSITHWRRHDKQEFKRHMKRWVVPQGKDPLSTRNAIEEEVAQHV